MVTMTIDRYITGAKKFYDEVLNRDITAKDVRRGLTGLVAGAIALTAVAGTNVREARAGNDALTDYLLGKALGRATENVVDDVMGKNDQQQTTQQSEPEIVARRWHDLDNSGSYNDGRETGAEIGLFLDTGESGYQIAITDKSLSNKRFFVYDADNNLILEKETDSSGLFIPKGMDLPKKRIKVIGESEGKRYYQEFGTPK